jgi:hypothetical protein
LRQASSGSLEIVHELDGVWEVRRTGGLLPPLFGVRKEIHGTHGRTLLPGGIVGIPFDVVGLELHYRAPFVGFVDIVVPHGGGFSGRATFRRRTFGRFELSPLL